MIQANMLLEKKMKMTEAELMLSQIKPHFIYNVLANIKSLIFTDPDQAETVIVAFARFLRTQLESIGQDDMMPFENIIDFIENYLEIEKSRYPGRFRVEYDIGYRDFLMPHFILQPLVENAIKHGFAREADKQNVEQGVIIIRSRQENDAVIIEVEDNGCGFRADTVEQEEKKKHVGIQNVKTRINYLMHGTLKLESIPGKGTIARITAPIEGGKQSWH